MVKHDNLLLQNQLCFALYAATNSVVRFYRNRLADVGLTYPQYLVLVVLWERDAIPVNQIAATLRLDSASISPILKRLEAAGLLARHRPAHDERRLEIVLTDAGRDLQDRVAEIQHAVACQTELDENEFFELRGALMRLADSMTAGDEDAVA
ncbi:MAG: MarR family transcriptional regulator [Gammaproteobacteria bacterium]|nr:MarR family transcriptional regulator [Gammaproteobacteria bacterium]